MAAPRNLRQILLNLLGNAVKFTSRGRVTLRVSGEPRAGDLFRLRVEVEDTGCGIARQDLERAFEPFQQLRNAERRVEGTGLGLSISRKLVELMGGKLTVVSRLGEGSQFTVEIDVRAAEFAAQGAVQATRPIVGYGGARRSVLIVDDTADNRRILSSFLAAIGFEVREAVDGVEAVAAVAAATPDIMFMDLVMTSHKNCCISRAWAMCKRDQPASAGILRDACGVHSLVRSEERARAPEQERDGKRIAARSIWLDSNLCRHCRRKSRRLPATFAGHPQLAAASPQRAMVDAAPELVTH